MPGKLLSRKSTTPSTCITKVPKLTNNHMKLTTGVYTQLINGANALLNNPVAAINAKPTVCVYSYPCSGKTLGELLEYVTVKRGIVVITSNVLCLTSKHKTSGVVDKNPLSCVSTMQTDDVVDYDNDADDDGNDSGINPGDNIYEVGSYAHADDGISDISIDDTRVGDDGEMATNIKSVIVDANRVKLCTYTHRTQTFIDNYIMRNMNAFYIKDACLFDVFLKTLRNVVWKYTLFKLLVTELKLSRTPSVDVSPLLDFIDKTPPSHRRLCTARVFLNCPNEMFIEKMYPYRPDMSGDMTQHLHSIVQDLNQLQTKDVLNLDVFRNNIHVDVNVCDAALYDDQVLLHQQCLSGQDTGCGGVDRVNTIKCLRIRYTINMQVIREYVDRNCDDLTLNDREFDTDSVEQYVNKIISGQSPISQVVRIL